MSPNYTSGPDVPENRPTRFLRMSEVADRVGLHKRTIWRLIAAESFPQPVPLGDRAVGFVESEIEDWMRKKIESRNPKQEDADE